jgi:hypothetical protein
LKYIYRLGIHTAFIFLILSFLFAMSDSGSLHFAAAQNSFTGAQDESPATETFDTFQIDGEIGSLVTDLLNPMVSEGMRGSAPIYVLVGNWSMGIVNGEINYLQVDFIMGLDNGTQVNIYSVENLRNIVIPSSSSETGGAISNQGPSTNLVLRSTNNYSLSLFGYVDVLIGDSVQWQNVPTSIDIFNGNTISILLYPSDTDNHFKGQPIYGIVTEILDADNRPIKSSIWTADA